MEQWKDIPGYEGLYQVSDAGRVRSLPREVNNGAYTRRLQGRILKPQVANKGYMKVSLYRVGSTPGEVVHHQPLVHRLVAEVFIPNPEGHPQVNHKNTVQGDNRAENLEWISASGNQQHAMALGIVPKAEGEAHYAAKLTRDQVQWIRTHCVRGSTELGYGGLAKMFGVSRSAIQAIVTGRNWKQREGVTTRRKP